MKLFQTENNKEVVYVQMQSFISYNFTVIRIAVPWYCKFSYNVLKYHSTSWYKHSTKKRSIFMVLFGTNKTEHEEEPEISKAREYLNNIHHANHLLYGREPYHYVETSQKENYARYHFYKGTDKRLIYIVLSEEERNEIERIFKERMGKEYVYIDTIYSDIFGDVVQHRFEIPNGSGDTRAYMTDDGKIGEGYLRKED